MPAAAGEGNAVERRDADADVGRRANTELPRKRTDALEPKPDGIGKVPMSRPLTVTGTLGTTLQTKLHA